jgi:hypothetical protein
MSGLMRFLKIVHSLPFEENGNMQVRTAAWDGDTLRLQFEVDDGEDRINHWDVTFSGVLELHLADVVQCGFRIHRGRHSAIHQYTQPREQLYFAAAPDDPDRVVGQLWAAHRAVADDWIPFDRFLNCELPPAALLATGSGLLASGPRFLIDAYARVLKQQRCAPSRVELAREKRPRRALLAHFSESYVIAETLTVAPCHYK